MTTLIPPFKANTLEKLAQYIGETNEGLTGTQIHQYLLQSNIEESKEDMAITKWKRLFNAFANFQNKNRCANNIVKFLSLVLSPQRYTDNKGKYDILIEKVNQQLAFEGFQIDDSGEVVPTKKASTIEDVMLRVKGLKKKLEVQNAHPQVFAYCKKELITDNYFHAVFEASKGLFQRIRDISCINKDGVALIDEVFSKNPIVIINNYITSSEQNEHEGYANMLRGLCKMFRNPEAHEPEINWPVSEQDALEILGIISYFHRRLDNAQKIR